MGNIIARLSNYLGDKLDRGLCVIGMHHWSHPGGDCIVCGKHDDFFEMQRDKDFEDIMGEINERDS